MSLSTFPSIPYPSNFVPNFVTVKLSGRDMYDVWKTQILCFLESHGMLGFINGEILSPEGKGNEKVEEMEAWRRSDSLVKGWILGSLSEQTLSYVHNSLRLQTNSKDFSAKDVWDKLQSHYNPRALQRTKESEEAKLNKEEIKTREADITIQVNSESEEAKLTEEEIAKEEEKKKKEAEEIENVHQSLYEATLSQNIEDIKRILKTGKVKVTDKITINGNTALHVAVGTTKKKKFLVEMLDLTQKDNNKLDMTNSEGSTLLHVASIVGNTEAAKMLVKKKANLFAKDKEGQTPLARAFSNMHTETYLYLLNPDNIDHDIEMGSFYSNKDGEELVVNAISSKDFDSAVELVRNYDILHSDAVLMAMAQNFPSEPNTWETIVSNLIEVLQTYAIDVDDARRKYCKKFYQDKGRFLSQPCNVGLLLLHWACIWIQWFFMAILGILAWPFMFVHIKYEKYRHVKDLSYHLCFKIRSKHSNSVHQYYTKPILEASRQNAHRFVEIIVYYFPNAIWSTNEDGHNIIQYAVINRSEKVYNLLYQMSEHKNIYKTIKDSSGNNLLHLAATLAPPNKLNLISGAALQIQRELQWFQEVQNFVCQLNIMQKNSFKETPQMIFTREHKELVIEGEKWMKTTAESYTITAALITTIMFAAAITVPGGNNENTGIPIFTYNAAFSIFAVSDAISLFTSVTSLLMFLSILTARFAEQDFLFKLPTKLVIGLVTLFVSTTAMIIAFGATLFLVFRQSHSWILVPVAVLTCLPITSFVTLQLPLVCDFIRATYGRSIFGKKSDRPFY